MPTPLNTATETINLWGFLNDPIGFLSDVEHGNTRLILTLDGKALGVVIPMRDLQKLESKQAIERRSEP